MKTKKASTKKTKKTTSPELKETKTQTEEALIKVLLKRIDALESRLVEFEESLAAKEAALEKKIEKGLPDFVAKRLTNCEAGYIRLDGRIDELDAKVEPLEHLTTAAARAREAARERKRRQRERQALEAGD